MNTRLRKKEILRGYDAFREVFEKGDSMVEGAVRCVYLVDENQQDGFQVGFAVSKSVDTAVMKVRLKRLLREAFRLNRSVIEDHPKAKCLRMVLLFAKPATGGPNSVKLADIAPSVVAVLQNLRQRLEA